jgi:uncharacterized protein
LAAELLLFVGMLAGLVSILFGLPGAAIILACILVYALFTGFSGGIGVALFIALSVLTLVAETADNWLTAVGAKRYGASTGSMWLSFFGGLVGAIIVGGPLSLVFGPLGPVAGGFAGAFAVVVLYEYNIHHDWQEAFRAGWGTVLGRMAGMVLKVIIAIAMIITVAIAVF